jgi:hypothetical protein
MSRPGVGDEQYRVPKTAVPVIVSLDGGTRVSGELHLLPEAGLHEGRERVIDTLAAPEPFLPITGIDGARIIHKRRIVTVRVRDEFDAGLSPESRVGATEVPVQIDLAGLPVGESIVRGRVVLMTRPGHERVVDLLNESPGFLAVLTEDEVTLIGLRYVVALRCL